MTLDLIVLIIGLTWLALILAPPSWHKPIAALAFVILALWLLRLAFGVRF
jgi:hypothetical protein